MGKKGVILDNGKSASSSMALYWKKNREQGKKPKKQYQPTQEEQLDQRVQSGFEKWKLHKQKMINKNYEKKQKPAQTQKQSQSIEEDQEQHEMKNQKPKGPVHIPGFKSKQTLKHKLKVQEVKKVSQHDNVLKLPSHMNDLSQQDIIRILRQKKAKSDLTIKKKQKQQKEDVLLGQDFLQSFKKPLAKAQDTPKLKNQQEQKQQNGPKQQENYFKSDILNQISKGNNSVLINSSTISKQGNQASSNIQQQQQKQNSQQILDNQAKQLRPKFIPRALAHKK